MSISRYSVYKSSCISLANMSTIRRAYTEISNGIRGLKFHKDQSPSKAGSDALHTHSIIPITDTFPNSQIISIASTASVSADVCHTKANTSDMKAKIFPSKTNIPSTKTYFSAKQTAGKTPVSTQHPLNKETSMAVMDIKYSADTTTAKIKKTSRREDENDHQALIIRWRRSPEAGIACRIRRLNRSINRKQHLYTNSMSELMLEDRFLRKFFRYFSPTERGQLCRVCHKWYNTLYRPCYWLNATIVVSYRQRQRTFGYEINLRHVYDSIQQRDIKSVCLFWATDQDVNEFVNYFQTSKSKIQSFSIRCSNISDHYLEVLLRKMKYIQYLELFGCNNITEPGIWSCLLANIEILCVMDCINVADDTLHAICQLLPSLKELNLQAYHVTDSALAFFSQKQNQSLSVLRFYSCWEITNNGLMNVVNALPNLKVLGLSGCNQVTDDGIEYIAENLKRLKVLDLSCTKISDASLEFVACGLNQLEEIVLDRYI